MNKKWIMCIAGIMTFVLGINIMPITIYSNDEIEDTDKYVEYNYVTGEEKILTLDEIVGVSAESYNNSNEDRIALPYNMNMEEMVEENFPYSLIPGSELKNVGHLQTPYSCVMYLHLGRDEDGDGKTEKWYDGTGFLVYSNIMVTAGHCMYNLKNGNVEEMRVYKNQISSTLNDDNFCYPATWITPANYKASANINYDWCIVTLQKNFGDQIGAWFGYATYGTGNLSNSKAVTVTGYPSCYPHFQYKSTGTLTPSSTYRFYHTASTEGGQSGGPAFDANGIVWGIHTHGDDGTSRNSGTLITQEMFNILESKRK